MKCPNIYILRLYTQSFLPLRWWLYTKSLPPPHPRWGLYIWVFPPSGGDCTQAVFFLSVRVNTLRASPPLEGLKGKYSLRDLLKALSVLIHCFVKVFIYLFGVLHHFQHCTGHITTGSWKGRENQYIQFVRVLYCKLLNNGKQVPAFPLEAVPGTEPWSQRWEARVLPLPMWPRLCEGSTWLLATTCAASMARLSATSMSCVGPPCVGGSKKGCCTIYCGAGMGW